MVAVATANQQSFGAVDVVVVFDFKSTDENGTSVNQLSLMMLWVWALNAECIHIRNYGQILIFDSSQEPRIISSQICPIIPRWSCDV